MPLSTAERGSGEHTPYGSGEHSPQPLFFESLEPQNTDMKVRVPVVWTCTVLISLFVQSHQSQKLNVYWGPQSMMYLKGKHGRRFVSDEDHRAVKGSLQDWYWAIRGLQKMSTVVFTKPHHIVSSDKVLIQYLMQR